MASRGGYAFRSLQKEKPGKALKETAKARIKGLEDLQDEQVEGTAKLGKRSTRDLRSIP
jgi:hypothetical protein